MAPAEYQTREISDKIAIVTATLYNPDSEKDNLRSNLAKSMIKRAADLGYEVFIVDGGSSDELLREFEIYGSEIVQQKHKMMGERRREAIRLALNKGKKIIAWTEPEKEPYIREIVKTAIPILDGSADLVMPRRKSLVSYPEIQQYAEKLGNLLWKEMTGIDLDMWFGPKTWKRDASDYFLDYNGGYGDRWDSIFIPVVDMILDNKRVVSVEVEYTHPKEQTEAEEHDLDFHIKRMEQLNHLTSCLETRWRQAHERI